MSSLTVSHDIDQDRVATTNRSPNSAFIAPPGLGSPQSTFPVLVDTLRVRGPVSESGLPCFREKGRVDLVTGEVTTQTTSEYGELRPGLWLTVQPARRDGQYAVIEFSVPKYLHGDNVDGASLRKVEAAVREVYGLAERYVSWAVGPMDLGVQRLDLVRDFPDIPDFDLLVDGFAKLTPSRIPRTQWYHAHGQPTGLARGAKGRWSSILYHKGRQLSSLARAEADPRRRQHLTGLATVAATRCRYELQLRKPILSANNLPTVGAVLRSEDDLRRLVQHYFDRSHYNKEVGGMSKVQAAVRAMRNIPEDHKRACKMLGWLMVTALHEPDGIKDARTQRDLRALADKYGLTPPDVVGRDHRPTVGLDLVTGRQTRRLDSSPRYFYDAAQEQQPASDGES